MWWMRHDVSRSGQPWSENVTGPKSAPKPQQAKLNLTPPNCLLHIFAHGCTSLTLFPAHINNIDFTYTSIGPSLSAAVILIVLLSSHASVGGRRGISPPTKPVIKVWGICEIITRPSCQEMLIVSIQGRKAMAHLLSWGRPTPVASSSSGGAEYRPLTLQPSCSWHKDEDV